jgi:DNA-binding XRE family transcriptional regulator
MRIFLRKFQKGVYFLYTSVSESEVQGKEREMLSVEVDRQRVGQRVKKRRKAERYSIEGLAEKAGLSPVTVWKIEDGQNFKYDTLHKIAEVLGVSIKELMD